MHAPDRRERAAFTLVFLGQSAALSRFVQQIAVASKAHANASFDFIVSAGTELAADLEKIGVPVTQVRTFSRTAPWQLAWNFAATRNRIVEQVATTRPDAVITLMPHVWSPLIAPAIKRSGTRYATIVHDATPHPGDWTAWVTTWLLRDADAADLVLTLSRTVSEQLAVRGRIPPARIIQLFHPDLSSAVAPEPRMLPTQRPLRILFFGRIMAYKGLPLLIDAVELLTRDGVAVSLGVAGEGDLGDSRSRLDALGAEIINRWIADDEAAALLARYDAMACSHIEASQSGVAALAFGHGMPVIALPVGGIAEQVVDAKTGILAKDVSARGFAEAVKRLIGEGDLYDGICRHLAATRADRSMPRFLEELERAVVGAGLLQRAPVQPRRGR
jgi:glycosyltransferase involved in cell wall biosynthesis